MNDRTTLDRLEIASPCSADWSAMQGDDKRRFCSDCKLHVHDLSAMTTDEAMDVLRAAGQGRLCVRFHRRADGRVLTQDCPVGLRQKVRRAWARAAAMATSLWALASCSRAPAPVVSPELGGAVAPAGQWMGDVATPPKMGEATVPAPGGVQPSSAPVPPTMGKVRAK